MLVKRIAACTHLSSTVYEKSYSEILVGNRNFFLPLLAFNAPVRSGPRDNRGMSIMSRGWKEDSMSVKRFAVYTHLSSTVSQA